MSLYVDEKYVNSLSHLLRNFKKKADYQWNFSCPLCGDSKKKKFKARGYIFRYKENLRFKCHNCGETLSISEFIRLLDASQYKEYIYETYLEKGQKPPAERELAKFKKNTEYRRAKPTVLIGTPSIISLPPTHPARVYLESRQLPEESLAELYWTDHFPALVDKFLPENEYNLIEEGRIIIPFFDNKHEIIALQGRSMPILNEESGKWEDPPGAIRYITIKADKDAPRVFGMERLSKLGKRIYIVEGPFDSLFLPNAVAMAGSDLPEGFPKASTVVVYDNERHSETTVAKISKAIALGYSVCIWPDSMKEKDINNMVLAGYKPEKVRDIIDTNQYKGLQASLELQQWANPKGLSGKGNGKRNLSSTSR